MLTACKQNDSHQFEINGKVDGQKIDQVYLFKILNENYRVYKMIDTIKIENNQFKYTNDTLSTQLYFISSLSDLNEPATYENGEKVFLIKGKNNLKISLDKNNKLMVEMQDAPLQKEYKEFLQRKDAASQKSVIDSFETLFYAARERNDTIEMQRIKEVSMPYYYKSDSLSRMFIKKTVEEKKGTTFGLYTFYTYQFMGMPFTTQQEINDGYKVLENLDNQVKESAY